MVRTRPAALEILEYTSYKTHDHRVLSHSLNLLFLDPAGEEINDEAVDSLEAAMELALAAYGVRREDWTLTNDH